MIRASEGPSEATSLRSSLLNNLEGGRMDEMSFQLNFAESSRHAIDRFMNQVRQRKLSLLENADLSVGSVQEAFS